MLDLSVIIVVSIFGIIGYKRGFIKSILTFGTSIIALVLSFIVYPMMTMLLRITPVYTWIYQTISKKVEDISFGGGLQSQGDAITKNITWMPDILVEQVKNNNNTAMYDLLGATNIKEYISLYVTQMLMGMLALFLTWVVLKIILTTVIKLLSGIIEHLPIISTFNKQGGLCLGIIKGILMLSIVGLIIPILIEIPSIQSIYLEIQSSYLSKWLYENNLIIMVYNYLFHI
ncbi:CvpA family protein [Cellulosilyticum sp. ST5]|uniref:Colicin V production protein n=1 Tax=Cellulosilyticum lentocellum (strain ATCC 49066 / DSM 5427 / NCIMB 11756 / RHM5) TaxID=642492 RepID=F2JRY5_CELLD|nr:MULTISPECIES: CvpA family protein [Cellulosilyticum]ADZ82799.1 Colicin V production protein [Cellulosilyticum lentocellum DSM 5427]QEH68342.1 CvpA family protein [Cellulosilyticum sp. WCF-2]